MFLFLGEILPLGDQRKGLQTLKGFSWRKPHKITIF
jgi:hypothetical protein